MLVTEISPISTMYTSIYTVTGLPEKKIKEIKQKKFNDLTWQNTMAEYRVLGSKCPPEFFFRILK